MINRKMMKSTILITAILLSLTACGKKEQPVSAEPVQTIEESTEESLESLNSLEVTPSSTVEPTTEPEEESSSNEESSDNTENEVDTTEDNEENTLGYEIIPMDDTVMYATTNCNLRSGPSTDYDKVGGLSYAQEVTVNGKVETEDGKLWWVLKSDTEEKQMVSGGLVSTTKPVQQSSSGNGSSTGTGGGTPQQPSSGGNGSGNDGFDAGAMGLPEWGSGGFGSGGQAGHWDIE